LLIWDVEGANDMKTYIISLVIGGLVGVLYAALHVRSPAPPLVALVGLLGMVMAENAWPHVIAAVRASVG
jgi:XapX domain-containing protein